MDDTGYRLVAERDALLDLSRRSVGQEIAVEGSVQPILSQAPLHC